MKTLTLAAVLAAGLAAAPAFAQPGNPESVVVRHADLDLRTAEGRAALDRRVFHAARFACGTPSPADLRGRTRTEQCVTEARAAARREIAVAIAQRQSRPVRVSSR